MKKINIIVITLFSIQLCFSQTEDSSSFTKLIGGLHFPEGPAWDGNGNLYVSSCHGSYITKLTCEDAAKFIDSTSTPNFKLTNGLTVFKDRSIFACESGLGAISKITPEGKAEIFISSYNGEKFNRPNDLAFGPNGNLYFTDPKSYGNDKLDGRVFMVELNSKIVKLISDSLAFPNGIAFSADGKKLFVCESARNRILFFDVNQDGSLFNKSVFAELPGGDPDGLAFDVDGNLYAAHFGGGAIYVISPEGKIKKKLIAPGKRPSNVEFGGDDMKTLFITEDETNCVFSTKVDIPGLKLFSSP